MNKVILIGRLTKDVELRYTQTNNTAVASFSLAVNRKFVKPGEERQADFFNIIAWNKLAENISKYLFYWMLVVFFSGYINSICNKATILHYTKEKVEKTPIVLPSIVEQKSIVNYLDAKCSEIDALLQNYEDQIATLEEYKKSLIYEYVTGKKEVPEA